MFRAVVWNGSTPNAIVHRSPAFSTPQAALKWGNVAIAILRKERKRRKKWRGKILRDEFLYQFFGDHS